jgi:hypothetical protein
MKFGDRIYWKLASFYALILCLCPLKKSKDNDFKDQIKRSALSIPADISDGFETLWKGMCDICFLRKRIMWKNNNTNLRRH